MPVESLAATRIYYPFVAVSMKGEVDIVTMRRVVLKWCAEQSMGRRFSLRR